MDIKIAELFYNTDLDVGYIKNVHPAIKDNNFIFGCTKCNKLSGFKLDAKKLVYLEDLKYIWFVKVVEMK